MKNMFTIHAGEFLVGSTIERQIPEAVVWLPAKDTGIDLLITNSRYTRSVSIQVKFSKDFPDPDLSGIHSWFKFDRRKLKQSKADLWVFVIQPLQPLSLKPAQYVVIIPKELDRRLTEIHRRKYQRNVHTYFWVTEKGKCWETRDLPRKDQILISDRLYKYKNPLRDFTKHLNAWKDMERMLR